jgi:hypothetical protein
MRTLLLHTMQGYCFKHAVQQSIAHAQLPISEYVKLNCRTVLAINHGELNNYYCHERGLVCALPGTSQYCLDFILIFWAHAWDSDKGMSDVSVLKCLLNTPPCTYTIENYLVYTMYIIGTLLQSLGNLGKFLMEPFESWKSAGKYVEYLMYVSSEYLKSCMLLSLISMAGRTSRILLACVINRYRQLTLYTCTCI